LRGRFACLLLQPVQACLHWRLCHLGAGHGHPGRGGAGRAPASGPRQARPL